MNQSDQRMEKAAFIAWAAASDSRCELVDGRVVEVPRVTRAHARIVGNVLFCLSRLLDRKTWEVLGGFGVETGPATVRYPDIVVDRLGGHGSDYTAIAPALLIEVLSPETATADLGDKAAEYQRIASLLAYIVLSEDEPRAWVYRRVGNAMSGPAEAEGKREIIPIANLNIDLPMAQFYERIKTNDQ
jgi:Uma2 family endonuclease